MCLESNHYVSEYLSVCKSHGDISLMKGHFWYIVLSFYNKYKKCI